MKHIKSIILTLLTALLSLPTFATSTVALATREQLQAAGLSSSPTEIPGGTIIFDNDIATLSLAYTDEWGTDEFYGIHDNASSKYRLKVGDSPVFTIGVSPAGQTNPAFSGYEAGVMSTGSVFKIDAKQTGWITVFTILFNPDKKYVVFENETKGVPYTLGGSDGYYKINYCQPMYTTGENAGYINLDDLNSERYFQVMGSGNHRPESPYITAGWDSSSDYGMGYLTFKVKAGNSYYVSGLGTRLLCQGYVFSDDATEPAVTFLATDDLPEVKFNTRDNMPKMAGEHFEADGIVYTVLDAEAKTVKTKDGSMNEDYTWTAGNSCAGDLEIPSIVSSGNEYYSVVAIGDHSFDSNVEISSVIFPESVSTIGASAFISCGNLTSITFSSNLTSIGSKAFRSCIGLKEVVLPESLTEVSEGLFYDCYNLEKVTLPNSIRRINFEAFTYTRALKTIELPESLTSIDNSVFYGGGLTSLELPSSVESIGDLSFSGCPIESVSLPAYLQSIGSQSFSDCYDIRTIKYYSESLVTAEENIFDIIVYDNGTLITPNATMAEVKATLPWNKFLRITASDGSVAPIREGDDFEYEGITYTVLSDSDKTCKTKKGQYIDDVLVPGNKVDGNIEIPSTVHGGTDVYSVVEIGDCGFIHNDITSISLPETIKYISGNAFDGCSKLSEINFPESLVEIGLQAFRNCSSLVSLNFPESLTSISFETFQGCTSLVSVSFKSSITEIESAMFEGCTNLTNVTLPENLTSIKNSAFNGCSSLKSIQFPETLTSIGEGAFMWCTGLTSIDLPSSLKQLEPRVFYSCQNLNSISLPDAITFIGSSVFDGCEALTVVNYSASSLIEADDDTFSIISYPKATLNTPNATLASVQATVPWNKFGHINAKDGSISPALEGGQEFEYEGIVYTVIDSEAKTVKTRDGQDGDNPGNHYEGALTIPSTITYDNNEYTVVEIGHHGFCSLSGLTSVAMPATVVKLGEAAFYNCENLTSVELPDSLREVEGFVFDSCVALTSVTLPEGLEYVGERMFAHCHSLTSATLPSTIKEIRGWAFGDADLSSIDLPDALETIGGEAFTGNKNIASINFPDKVTAIWDRAFSGCSFTSLIFPESLQSLGDGAFYHNYELESIVLPASITSIGLDAFGEGDDKLDSVTYNAEEPIEANSGIFGFTGELYDRTTLIMPNATLAAIQAVTPWNLFKRINAKDGSIVPVKDGDNFEYDGLTYTIISVEDKTCRTKEGTIVDNQYVGGNSFEGALTIPATVSDGTYEYTVTEIGTYGFANCTTLTSVSIPASVTAIPESAFNGCSGLQTVALPESLTSISVNAFLGCSALTAITLPETLTSLGHGAFTNCSSLESIVIPESLTMLDNQVFSGCSSLKKIDLPATLEGMGYGAFFGCDPNVEVTYKAETPVAADENAFSENAYVNGSLNTPNATLAAVQTTIPWNKFLRITASDGYVAPAGEGEDFEYEGIWYTVIDAEAKTVKTKDGISHFEGPTPGNIVEGNIVIPSIVRNSNTQYSVVELGNRSFSNSADLISIEIPESVRKIGESAFYGCSSLTSINIPEGVNSISESTFYNCAELSSIELPNSLTSIGNYAFTGAGITAIVIPESVTTIGDYSFWKCTNLDTANIPGNIVNFGLSVFSACSNLVSINIPEALNTIPGSTFSECSSLASIDIPNSVTEIGEQAFSSCKSLTSIKIPESVTSIGAYAFFACSNLETVILPSKITEIANSTFEQCYQLTEIVIPDDVTAIGNRAFWTCKNLVSVNFPKKLTTIGKQAFYQCSSLVSVDLPEGLISIGEVQSDQPFYECTSLKSLSLPGTLKLIPQSAFSGCNVLEEINFSEGLKIIDVGAFKLCSRLKEILLPQSLDSLGAQAFWYAGGVKVSLPATISSIGNMALQLLDNLEEVEYLASIPKSFEENIFNPSSTYHRVVLKMPNATLADIQSTTPWNQFQHIIAKDGSVGFEASGDDFEYEGVWYTVIDADAKTCGTRGQQYDYEAGNYVAGNNCSGELVIPAKVSYGQSEYSVVEIGVRSFLGNELTSVSIPEGVTAIRVSAFDECRSLTTVQLPESLTEIGGTAFQVCINLSSINWPSSLKKIDGGAFNYCHFTSLNLPEGLEELGKWAFQGNPLSSVGIPASLISVEDSPFNSCTGISEVNYTAETPVALAETLFPSEVYQNATLNTPKASLAAVQATVPWNKFLRITASDGSVAPAGEGEDFEYEGILYTVLDAEAKTCKTKDGISSNGQLASYNDVMGDLVIPAHVSDGSYEYTVMAIGRYGFANVKGITSVIIPETITSIPESAFEGCSNLTSATIPETVTLINLYAFSKCGALTDVKLPNALEAVGSAAFNNCSSLTSIVIPEKVTSLGNQCFASCSNVKTIDIPASVELFDYRVFGGCSADVEVTYRAENPVTAGEDLFDVKEYANGTLKTPNATLESVQATVPWNKFLRITASDGSVVPFATEVTLNQTAAELKVGEAVTLEATVIPENATEKTVTWKSDNEKVATVDSNGKVTAIALGEATITATCGPVSATCKVTVVPTPVESVTLSNTSLSLTEGETSTLTATVAPADATDKTVTWTSSDASVATVSANGVVTALKAGTATITATTANGKSASCSVTVASNIIPVANISISNTELNLTEGEAATLTATVTPSDATDKTVTWTSSDASVATVSANGAVTALKAGTAIITASSSNGKTASCTVRVAARIIDATGLTLSQSTAELKAGETVTLEATVIPENTTDNTVTWTSDNVSVATVDSNGKVTAISIGEATITATCGNVTATCKVTVVPTPVESITLSNTSLSLVEGNAATLTATVAPADATDKTVTWSSSDPSVATVSANGEVTAVKAGTATITATSSNGKTATCTVTVVAMIIDATDLTLNRTSAELKVGQTITLEATVLPEDATDKTVTWRSDNERVATVDANGKVTAISLGDATITATCGQVT
ncbi:MAG: leucine-rich repeat protein, partial [Muribaculaceae bacterium]|nr:leucine-rich repeat protein [Muribaculaceae bacterium]